MLSDFPNNFFHQINWLGCTWLVHRRLPPPAQFAPCRTGFGSDLKVTLSDFWLLWIRKTVTRRWLVWTRIREPRKFPKLFSFLDLKLSHGWQAGHYCRVPVSQFLPINAQQKDWPESLDLGKVGKCDKGNMRLRLSKESCAPNWLVLVGADRWSKEEKPWKKLALPNGNG